MKHLVVDGMNVIGSRPDGWWRDRDGAVRRLHTRLGERERDDEAIVLVLDGRPLEDLPEGVHDGIEVLYARRSGRDAADDRIVELVDAKPPSERANTTVVTSDRELAERARALGADVIGARSIER